MRLIQVTKQIRWFQLFGETGAEIPVKARHKRWEKWKALLIADGETDLVNYWAKDAVAETCRGCKHRDGDWCNAAGLPCNVNPILTFNDNLVGMACGGAGYNRDVVQGQLF